MRMQVHGTRSLARAELIRIGEGIFEELHYGHDAAGLVLDLLDRCPGLAQIRQGQCHAAAALGQLQGGVDAARDRLHIVLDAQKETGDELASGFLPGVEEGWGGGLETPRHHLVNKVLGEGEVSSCEVEGDHGDAVLEALQVALPVEGLEGVGGVVLEGSEEGREAELVGVGAFEQRLDIREVVLGEDFGLVVALPHEVVEFFLEVVEEHRVLIDVLEEVLACGLAVGLKLDVPVLVVEVQLSVEGVVVELRVEDFLYSCVGEILCQNSFSPLRTRETSSAVPRSSNLYMWGTPSFAATISPARQYAVPKFVLPDEMTPTQWERFSGLLRKAITCLGTAPLRLPPP